MIINTKLTIRRPQKQVWDYLDQPENLTKWIQGLKSYHQINGDPETLGAHALYVFGEGDKEIEMTGEILAAKEPEEFSVKLYHKDLEIIVNYSLFEEANDTTTLICNSEYRFRDLYWEVFSHIMKSRIQYRQNFNLMVLKKLLELDPVAKED